MKRQPDASEGAAILRQLHDVLTRYVILPSAEAAAAVTLWIAASHAQSAWAHAPRLVIRAPEKRCGKTTALSLLGLLARRPLLSSNISPAALFRTVEKYMPTLLVDEAESVLPMKG